MNRRARQTCCSVRVPACAGGGLVTARLARRLNACEPIPYANHVCAHTLDAQADIVEAPMLGQGRTHDDVSDEYNEFADAERTCPWVGC